MERALELLALLGLVAVLGVALLSDGRRTIGRQAAMALTVGIASAIVVLSQFGDLVPDGLEPWFATAGAAALVVAATVALIRWRRSRTHQTD